MAASCDAGGSGPEEGVHLVVLSHGLWGRPADTQRLADHLAAGLAARQRGRGGGRVEVLNAACNTPRALTYDGIDVCGGRVAAVIAERVRQCEQAGTPVRQLSLVGYSLGGLILRFAAGKLFVDGLFDSVAPANLVTIATPHLGSWREPTSAWARFFNRHVHVIASRTGRQLMLRDEHYTVAWLAAQQEQHDRHHEAFEQRRRSEEQARGGRPPRGAAPALAPAAPPPAAAAAAAGLPPGVRGPLAPVPLLLLMSHPAGPFHRAAAAFRTRVCCANVSWDSMVPYATAAIALSNPYESAARPIAVDPRFPSVVRPSTPAEEAAAAARRPPPRGRERAVVLLLFLPLLPALYVYLTTYGILHHRRNPRPPGDASWLSEWAASWGASIGRRRSLELLPGGSGGGGGLAALASPRAAAALAAPSCSVHSAAAHGDSGDTLAVPAGNGAKQPQQQQQQQQQQEAEEEEVAAALAAATAAAEIAVPPPGLPHTDGGGGGGESSSSSAVGGGSSEGGGGASAAVVEHGGIVERPHLLREQQRWMQRQLFHAMPPCVVHGAGGALVRSAGGWQRVDVDTGHVHAHAVIVIRDARYAHTSRDFFDFLVETMTL